MKHLFVLAVPLVLSFNLTANAGVGDLLPNTCRVSAVNPQSRVADSLIPEISETYTVLLAHLDCATKMVLTGGITIQSFDSAFSTDDSVWLQKLQASGATSPAVFVDNAYSISVKSFAGRSDFVAADAPRQLYNSHSLTIQETESAYSGITDGIDQQSIPRVPFTLINKNHEGVIRNIPSWSRTLKFIATDRTMGLVINDVGPTNSKSGGVRNPQVDLTLSMKLTANELAAGGTQHALNKLDSQSLRAIYGNYLKINDVTTGSRINDRDLTFDCRQMNCVVTIEASQSN